MAILFGVTPTVIFGQFEWDKEKEDENRIKHGLDFYTASICFLDPGRIIAIDENTALLRSACFVWVALEEG
jgi:uncharacterized DUF497 family protein